jgi:uncharacterized protein (DUF1919 family)
MRQRVRSRDFSIISNDCWGGMAYEELAMRYESPFIGLFIVPRDYVRLLRNLRHSLEASIEFRTHSRDDEINAWREKIGRFYPVGVLPNDVEVHFLHYSDAAQAEAKWSRRCARLNWKKLRVKISWHNDPEIVALLREFDELPFKAKLILTPHKIVPARHCIALKDFSTDGTQQYWRAHKALDVATFLESGNIRRATASRILDWLLYWHY